MVQKRKLSPAVYRRRRLLAVAAVVAVVIPVVMVVSQAVNNFRQVSTQLNKPSTKVTPSSVPVEQEPECDRSQLVLTAATDAPSYTAGKDPVFTLTLTNNGKVACEVNVGTSQMEFAVTSGRDKVFSSRDCEEDPQDLVKVIAPGKSEIANFQWLRNRSVPGCRRVSEPPGVGPEATYRLTVFLGTMTSAPQSFMLVS